ncbi:MAG: TAXI family TRAP transporter solute-binding subunit [Clostridia bacterium]|nr:TAXI family TRAP transporter solute-binding subunit [Clostridia bacterium]
MKNFRTVLIALIIFTILFAGCSTDKIEVIVDEKTGFNNSPIITSLIHGNPSGVWFMMGTAISESLGKSYPGSIMHITPGQSTANIYRTNDFETEFALFHSSLVYQGYNGLGPFEEKMNNIGGIAVFYPSILQFAVRENLNIKTFDDFINNKVPIRISTSSKGGNSEVAFFDLIKLYGLTKEDLEGWGCELLSIENKDSGDAFSEGVIDGIFIMASIPNPSIQKMSTDDDMIMISFSDEVIEKMSERHGFNKEVVPKGSYNFVTEDIPSFTTYTLLGASSNTSDEKVYKVTKALVENIDYISSIHSSFENMSLDTLLLNMRIPLHPGAEKYYREIGILD